MLRLVPNEPFEPLPVELYDELEARDTYDEEEQINAILETTNLTVEEAEVLLADENSYYERL